MVFPYFLYPEDQKQIYLFSKRRKALGTHARRWRGLLKKNKEGLLKTQSMRGHPYFVKKRALTKYQLGTPSTKSCFASLFFLIKNIEQKPKHREERTTITY